MVQSLALVSLVRKVRIESTDDEPIQLYEVQIFSSGVNIAINGSASQSADYDSEHAASNAIDGNNTSFSLTSGRNAYWEVDLGSLYSVESVLIFNSDTENPFARMLIDVDNSYSGLDSLGIGDNSCRLTNAAITLYDNDNFVVSSGSPDGSTCGQSTVSVPFNLNTTFSKVSEVEGFCLDAYGNYYSYGFGGFSWNFTAYDCGMWCLQNPSDLIGFDFFHNSSDPGGANECYCLFDDGVPGVIGTYNPPYEKISHGEMGVGPITNVSGDSGWFCYQNDVSTQQSGVLRPVAHLNTI
jgi:hypothetical protein